MPIVDQKALTPAIFKDAEHSIEIEPFDKKNTILMWKNIICRDFFCNLDHMHYYMRHLFPRMKAPSFFVEGQNNRESERKKQRSQVVCLSIKVSMVCVHSQSTQSAWQRPFSGINSIMMEKLDQAGEGGGCTPTPFHYIYHHVQSCGVRCCSRNVSLWCTRTTWCTLLKRRCTL